MMRSKMHASRSPLVHLLVELTLVEQHLRVCVKKPPTLNDSEPSTNMNDVNAELDKKNFRT